MSKGAFTGGRGNFEGGCSCVPQGYARDVQSFL